MALRVDDVDLQRDRLLVERFQEGDDTAFETLYRRYFARLQRFCLKRVGDPLDAEEIAQEAFARAYRALPELGGERRFYPWMTVIASRLCVDHHRRRGRTEPTAVVELGAVDGGQDAVVERAEVALLGRALGRLAPRHREVLELRENRGWTYQAIADHYEVPIGTVEALLFRARKALRREFLAIAGSDRLRGVVAMPTFGLVGARLGAARSRLASWTSAVNPAVGTALGAAVVAGSAAVLGTPMAPGATEPTPAPVVRAAGQPAAADAAGEAPGPPAPAPTAPPVEAVTPAPGKGPSAAAPSPAADSAALAVEDVVVGDFEVAEQRAQEDMTGATFVPLPGGRLLVAVDLANVAGDLVGDLVGGAAR